jgi:hypothetical protein
MATRAKLSAAGTKLRSQINTAYPKRDKASDGWIGDQAHQKTKSDHNPDPKTGIVRAIDIDSDLGPEIDSWELAESLRQLAKAGEKRIAYVIHNKKIASPILGWVWRPYLGSNPHTQHIHVSFTKAGDTDGTKFGATMPGKKTNTPTARNDEQAKAGQAALQKELAAIKKEQAALTARITALEKQIKQG